jgi:ATP:corrinoid adenosyltransferase
MPTYMLTETVRSKTRHGFVILTGSDDAAQALARADRVRELIKVEVAASAPAGEVVAR